MNSVLVSVMLSKVGNITNGISLRLPPATKANLFIYTDTGTMCLITS